MRDRYFLLSSKIERVDKYIFFFIVVALLPPNEPAVGYIVSN